MLNFIKTYAFAFALTLVAAFGLLLASGIAAPQPAEAGIVSSVKGAAKAVGGGIKDAAKAVNKRVITPTGKNLYQLGKAAAKPFAPGVKVVVSGVKRAWPGVKKVAKIAFPVLR